MKINLVKLLRWETEFGLRKYLIHMLGTGSITWCYWSLLLRYLWEQELQIVPNCDIYSFKSIAKTWWIPSQSWQMHGLIRPEMTPHPGDALPLVGAQALAFCSLFSPNGHVGFELISTDWCSWCTGPPGDEVGNPCKSKIPGLLLLGRWTWLVWDVRVKIKKLFLFWIP